MTRNTTLFLALIIFIVGIQTQCESFLLYNNNNNNNNNKFRFQRGGTSSSTSENTSTSNISTSSSSRTTTTTTTTTSLYGSSSATSSTDDIDSYYDVVIVGGGPSGLATCLKLSNEPHNCKCLLLESNHLVDTYDPTKAFLYNVNARGLRLIKEYPNLFNKLQKQGVESQSLMRNFALVPGSPDVSLPDKIFDIEKRFYPSAGSKKDAGATTIPLVEPIDNKYQSYWIPRHDFTNILKEEVETTTDTKICMGMSCRAILPTTTATSTSTSNTCSAIEVIFSNTTTGENLTSVKCQLVIGADGYKSFVRDCMKKHSNLIDDDIDKDVVAYKDNNDDDVSSTFKQRHTNFQQHVDWETSSRNKFNVIKYKSPATGLRIKVLQLPPRFEIPYLKDNKYLPRQENKDEQSVSESLPKILQYVKTHGNAVYALRSIYTSPKTYTSLGVLPVKDNNSVRPVNLITRDNHIAWTKTTGNEMKQFMTQAYPRFFQLSKTFGESLVSDKEWERFAKANGTRFPHCQYTNGISLTSKDQMSGLTLVGDSIHSYPPDIGQGVNSGLLDVIKLSELLINVQWLSSIKKNGSSSISNASISTTTTTTITLGEALTKYEKDRLPESKALIQLARFGSPYQYRQPLLIDKIGRLIHTINFSLRLLLNKLTFGITPEPAIILARSHPNLTFQQVMKRCNIMTFFLGTITSWFIKRFIITTMSLFFVKK